MPAYVSDEILQLYAVVGTHAEIGSKLNQRFNDVVTHCEFSIAVAEARDKAMLTQIVAQAHGQSAERVRRRLVDPLPD